MRLDVHNEVERCRDVRDGGGGQDPTLSNLVSSKSRRVPSDVVLRHWRLLISGLDTHDGVFGKIDGHLNKKQILDLPNL